MPTSWRRGLVVGGSSGIGEAIARELAESGTEVAIVARRGPRGRVQPQGPAGIPEPAHCRTASPMDPRRDPLVGASATGEATPGARAGHAPPASAGA